MSNPGTTAAGSDASVPLIGAEGVNFVSFALSNLPPAEALRQIQAKTSLQHALCPPLLGMIDHLGISRADAHRGVLQSAKQALLARISALDKVKLERLLNSSFAYLGIQELREVPLAVMDKLEVVPPVFLKQLTADRQIFKDLPAKVQRQVWEFDKNLLQQDALPAVGQYKYEVATIMRALAMDEFVPAVSGAAATASAAATGAAGVSSSAASGMGPGSKSHGHPYQRQAQDAGKASVSRPAGITRKILRKGSRVLQILKGMVGSSQKIYNQIIELCVVKFRDSDGLYVGFKELSYCTLRAQLLMALHDDNNAISAKDKCHELAWTLDAGIMNGHLTDKHLQKLEKYFADVEAAERVGKAMYRSSSKAPQDEAESAGNASGALVEPYKVLGDAGTILRDPSAVHLLAAHAIQLTKDCALTGQLPRESQQLCFILQMLQLAVDSRQMLRDRKYKFPEPDPRVLSDVLPVLGSLCIDCELAAEPLAPEALTSDITDYGVPSAAVQKLVEVLPRSEVARRLVQVFVLERLFKEDYISASRMLKVLAQTLAPKAVAEVCDFAAALAIRLAELVKARRLPPTSILWRYAVDNLLVKAVDSHTQVHEEVLRLLLSAAPQLQPSELGTYLQLTLDHSKRSRKRGKKQPSSGDPLADFPMSLAADIGSDIGSDGWPGILALKIKSSDGVRSVYSQFRSVPGITAEVAPHLFAYLEEEKGKAGPD